MRWGSISDMLGPLQDGFELEIRVCIGNSDLLEFYNSWSDKSIYCSRKHISYETGYYFTNRHLGLDPSLSKHVNIFWWDIEASWEIW